MTRAWIGPRAIRIALAAAALAALSACGGAASDNVGTAADAAPRAAAAPAQPPTPATPSADPGLAPAPAPTPASELSAQSLALLRQGGSTLRPATEEEVEQATVSPAAAAVTASKRFGFFAQGRGPDEQILAKVTNDQYGDVVNPDDVAHSAMKPIIVDRLCWVAVYRGVQLPQPNPPRMSQEHETGGRKIEFAPGTLLVLIDAKSGKLLRAETH